MVRLSPLRARGGRPGPPAPPAATAATIVRTLRAGTAAALAAAFAGLVGVGPAFADVELEAKGPILHLHTDRLLPGDEQTFEAFIDQPRAEPIRIVYLDSRGGSTLAAIAIGRSIRQHGLATAFRVGQSRCVSACTTMFLGGVQRYYLDSAGVQDGVATRLGLGFHPSQGGARGEGMIEDYYRDMGVEGANRFRYAIYPHDSVMERVDGPNTNKLFFAGGSSALKAGVATSIAEPADARLRD